MTRNQSYVAAFAFSFAAAGCAPLQQAPLVYSSKQSLGIDFSTATTEQPGLALNLGFKSVDAAYVPVAVAKPCDNQDQAGKISKPDCANQIYEIKQIQGGNNKDDSNTQKETVENARRLLTEFSTASAAKKAADSAYAEAKSNLDKLNENIKKNKDNLADAAKSLQDANKQLTALPDPPKDDAGKDQLEKAKQSTKMADTNKTQLEKQVADLTSQIAPAFADLQKKKADVDQAQSKLEAFDPSKVADALGTFVTASTHKVDAYSVFGSFSTNTTFGTTGSVSGTGSNAGTAGNANASISIGKIFSTGVASQNLTEGIRSYYERAGGPQPQQAKSYVDCINATPARLKQIGLPDDMTKATDDQKKKAEAAYADCSKLL